jgi:GNAT superfamily N-acetyltransferase
VAATVLVGEVHRGHRARVAEILRATGVFNDAEVDVALELFDEVYETAGAGWRVAGGAEQAPPAIRHPLRVHPDYAFLGAFDATGELMGYACYGPTPGTDRTFDLYWIAVDPAAQGTGTGTLLLTEVERRVAALHARLLIVETSSRPESAATRAYYLARAYD